MIRKEPKVLAQIPLLFFVFCQKKVQLCTPVCFAFKQKECAFNEKREYFIRHAIISLSVRCSMGKGEGRGWGGKERKAFGDCVLIPTPPPPPPVSQTTSPATIRRKESGDSHQFFTQNPSSSRSSSTFNQEGSPFFVMAMEPCFIACHNALPFHAVP